MQKGSMIASLMVPLTLDGESLGETMGTYIPSQNVFVEGTGGFMTSLKTVHIVFVLC